MNLEGKGSGGSEGVGKLLDMDAGEVGALCHNHRMGETVRGRRGHHTVFALERGGLWLSWM